MEERFERYHPDMVALQHGFRTEPCFVCRLVGGDGDIPRHVFYEDDEAIAFLDSYPRAYGYTLVAPKEHREQVTADFAMEEYLELQKLLYRVTEAVREEVPLHLRLQRGQLARPLARRAVATRCALRGSARCLGELGQGRPRDTPPRRWRHRRKEGDGRTAARYREDAHELARVGAMKRLACGDLVPFLAGFRQTTW